MKPIRACVLISSILVGLAACKPDKPVGPISPPTPMDGRQKFVGVYDVYDTLGNWRYEMEISLHQGTSNVDSLFISNWGDAFHFYAQHDDGNTTNYLSMGSLFGIADYNGNRWALFREYDTLFNNTLINDTLRMSYLKDNIAFYVDDGVPYFRQSYREFAVKREPE
jgi:hypothetical protein